MNIYKYVRYILNRYIYIILSKYIYPYIKVKHIYHIGYVYIHICTLAHTPPFI